MRDPHDHDPTGGEPLGSVAEEATKLFGALADWAQTVRPEAAGFAGLGDQVARGAQAVDDHLATGAPECALCPVCRTVHLVRSPEVRAHLTAAASSLLQAAAAALATPVPDERSRAAGVERIDLDEPEQEPGSEHETGVEEER